MQWEHRSYAWSVKRLPNGTFLLAAQSAIEYGGLVQRRSG
jgi:hypothetical protein